MSDNKKLENQINSYRQNDNEKIAKELLLKIDLKKEFNVIIDRVDGVSDLRRLGDSFKQKVNNKGILVIASLIQGKPNVMASVTEDLFDSIDAISIVKHAGMIIDGGGGGKPGLAVAGGKNKAKLSESLIEVEKFIKEKITYE